MSASRELATFLAKSAAANNPPEYYTGDTFEPHGWVIDAVEQALNISPVADGTRCEVCQYIAPNLYGCAHCNPGPLGERLATALEKIETQREEIRDLEAEVRTLTGAAK